MGPLSPGTQSSMPRQSERESIVKYARSHAEEGSYNVNKYLISKFPKVYFPGGRAELEDHATPAATRVATPSRNAPLTEDPRYLSRQLITYIGNKRALLGHIGEATQIVCARQRKSKLRILDAFAGSGAVSRLFKRYASELVVNDIEDYSRAISECYLANISDFPYADVRDAVDYLNHAVVTPTKPQGFIERLYAPDNEDNITKDDRVFYTRDNARRLDAYRQLIEFVDPRLAPYLLGPLLSEASVHTNTAGVFKGFYKDRMTGVGRFGGSGSDALVRIKGTIKIREPVLSNYECAYEIFQADANELVEKTGEFDLAYLDPPYNQHPYGSNYFMLNLLVEYVEPQQISKVSGIPSNWRRSPYNVRAKALGCLRQLIHQVDARFVLISYNDEGFVSINDMRRLLDDEGSYEELQLKYTTFRGSRNLRNRNSHVTEHLFLLDKLKR